MKNKWCFHRWVHRGEDKHTCVCLKWTSLIGQLTHLLSGFRFSTAVWVWLVVSMETFSPSGPLAVEMTSYSDREQRWIWGHCFSQTKLWWQHTSCAVVCFVPVQDDKRRTSFHCNHRQVRGRGFRQSCYISTAAFVFGEVCKGGGDGARLIRSFSRLIYDMRSWRREEVQVNKQRTDQQLILDQRQRCPSPT